MNLLDRRAGTPQITLMHKGTLQTGQKQRSARLQSGFYRLFYRTPAIRNSWSSAQSSFEISSDSVSQGQTSWSRDKLSCSGLVSEHTIERARRRS